MFTTLSNCTGIECEGNVCTSNCQQATIASHVDCLCTNKILILRFKVDFAEVLCNFQGREAYLMGINTNYGTIRSTESWRCVDAQATEHGSSDTLWAAIVNPRRACAARVTVLVLSYCPSVRPSVRLSRTPYSATTRNKAAKKRYQRVQYHTVLIFKIEIFVKVLRSRVMA